MGAVKAKDNRCREKDRDIQLQRADRIVGNEGWKPDLRVAGYSKMKGGNEDRSRSQ